jgi:hypothetical protein
MIFENDVRVLKWLNLRKILMFILIYLFTLLIITKYNTAYAAITEPIQNVYSSKEDLFTHFNITNLELIENDEHWFIMEYSDNIQVFSSSNIFYIGVNNNRLAVMCDSPFYYTNYNKSTGIRSNQIYVQPNGIVVNISSDDASGNNNGILDYGDFNTDINYSYIFSSDRLTYNESIYFSGQIIEEPNNYMIWAPAYDDEGNLLLNYNNRAIYKTSSGSPYYLIASGEALSGKVINANQIELYSWGSECNFRWNDNLKQWDMVSQINGVIIDKNLLFANSPEILMDNNTTLPDNPDTLLLDEGSWTIDPNIIPEYTTANIPQVENFKVTKENWSKPYIVTWKPVFGEYYIELNLRVKFTKMQSSFNVSLEEFYKEMLIVPFTDLYSANNGQVQFSNFQLNDLVAQIYPEYQSGYIYNIYGFDIRYVGRQNDKFYTNNWASCEVLYNALTQNITKNVIKYYDDEGNLLDNQTIENIINDNGDGYYYGDLDLLNGTSIDDISMQDALNISNDMIVQVGKMPALFQKLMIFMPTDYWNLLFYGLALLLILRVLGR